MCEFLNVEQVSFAHSILEALSIVTHENLRFKKQMMIAVSMGIVLSEMCVDKVPS